jgi:hypothetical protein
MDVEQINNFMSTASKEEVQYSDAQWLYINDSNFGGYNNYLQCQSQLAASTLSASIRACCGGLTNVPPCCL